MSPRLVCTVLILSSSACVGPSPTQLTDSEDWMVVVNTVRLPDTMDWYTRFAEHAWIDIKQGSEDDWTRIEVDNPDYGIQVLPIPAKYARKPSRWRNRVSVLATLTGEDARHAIPRLLELAAAEPDLTEAGRLYQAWPGPNSNTFIATLVEGTPGLHAELHHNSVGKDYPPGFRVGITSGGYGVEVDTSYLGVGFGLRQGVELHLGQLTAGVGLWPPALKLPLLPRIGIHQGWVGAAGALE